MPLTKDERDILARIVKRKTGVSKGSMAGAIREIIGQWESLYTELHELRDKTHALTRELQALTEMIALHEVVTEMSREQISDNEHFDKAKEKMKTGLNIEY